MLAACTITHLCVRFGELHGVSDSLQVLNRRLASSVETLTDPHRVDALVQQLLRLSSRAIKVTTIHDSESRTKGLERHT